MDKLHLLYYGIIAFFLLIYALRTVLMVGYDHIKFKNKKAYAGQMFKGFFIHFVSLKPLFQRKLEPKGYDYKLYNRFQNKFVLYYALLWAFLFLILFFTAKITLGLF